MRFVLALALAGAVAVVATAAYGRGAARGVPRGFSPETGAAVGTHDLWVLGEYRCGGTWCDALVRSTDAGKHFTRVALPPFPSKGVVPTVRFANARDGIAYVLYGTTPLYVTHDGGRSWHTGPSGGVLGSATGGGMAYVVTRRQGLERSPVKHDAWRVVLRLGTQYPIGLAVRGKRIWLTGPPRRSPDFDTIRLSSNYGRTFTTRRGPCLSELGGRLAAASDGVVWAVCPTGMMAGLWVSTNGGRSFALRSFADPGAVGRPALTNGAEIAPFTARIAVLDGGGDGPLIRTTDIGKHWRRVRQPARIYQLDWLGVTTRRVGFALVQTGSSSGSVELWRTTDAGASWRSMPIR